MRQHIRCSKQPSGPVQSSTGSIDLTTGLFKHNDDAIEYQRRIRVIQACEKCRRKKSRCNGKHPCQRCLARRFRCEYAPERKIGRGVWFHPSVSPKQATASSATSDHYAITDPSTPASSDSSSVASDHQRFESTTPSTLNSYVADISSTQSSPLPPHHGPPEEMHRPRSAMAVGQSSSESSCNASDSSSDVRAAFTRRPRPRPLDPTRDCRKYPPLFSLPIETSVDFRTPFPTGLGPSNSRIVLHSSDAARGALASPSPYCPPDSRGVDNVLHPSPVIAGCSKFQSTNKHVMSNLPDRPFPIVSLSFASGAASPSRNPAATSTPGSSMPPTPPMPLPYPRTTRNTCTWAPST